MHRHPRESGDPGWPERTWIPAFAGMTLVWIPAFAGMTLVWIPAFAGMTLVWIPACAGMTLVWIPAFAGMTCWVCRYPLPVSCSLQFLNPEPSQFLSPAPFPPNPRSSPPFSSLPPSTSLTYFDR